MANDDFARGFIPLNTNGKGTVNSHYYPLSTATDIAIGMPLTIPPTTGHATRAAATGMTPVIGVALGFSYGKGGLNELDPWFRASRATDDNWYVQVADDPDQEFYIQEDTGGTALTSTAGGGVVDLVYQTTSIDTVSGVARLELDASTWLPGTGQVFHILRLHDTVNRDGTQNAVGDYAKWVGVFMHHQKRGGNPAAN